MTTNNLDQIIEELRNYIHHQVAAGFTEAGEISGYAVEAFSNEYDPSLLRPYAERLTGEALEAHRQAQATWPEVTDYDRLDAAFAELEQHGIIK